MSTSTITCREDWVIIIKPGPDENWPLLLEQYGRKIPWQPDQIRIHLARSGSSGLSCTVHVSGAKLKKDGTASLNRASDTWYQNGKTAPAWISHLVKTARAEHGLDGEDT